MSMYTNLKDFRSIDMLVNEKEDIVIFPNSKTDELFDDGVSYKYHMAFHPIELFSTYSREDLALKIQEGIESWNKYPPFDFSGKNSIEEKYYGIKGFKNAVFGKKSVSLGWDHVSGKYLSLSWPLKKGYGYMIIERTKLKDDADYIDFADAVLELIKLDVYNHHRFKQFKNDLLL